MTREEIYHAALVEIRRIMLDERYHYRTRRSLTVQAIDHAMVTAAAARTESEAGR